MRQWGDTKNYLYYITEFGAIKRKQGEVVTDFTKCFNKMYSKISAEIKPIETSAKLTYENSFDVEFYLLLRERRGNTLVNMQEASLELESNFMAAHKLKSRAYYQGESKKNKKEMPPSCLGTK